MSATAEELLGFVAVCMILRIIQGLREHHADMSRILSMLGAFVVATVVVTDSHATPANKSVLKRHYERFLSETLNRCTTCHLPSSLKNPENLEQFPHNQFGSRLRLLGEELAAKGKPNSLPARLKLIAEE